MAARLPARRWQDGGILLLGAWLFVSPWLMGYPCDSAPALNAFIAGATIAALAAFGLYKTDVRAVVANIVIGAWVAASPWVVNVVADRLMSTSMLIVGIATIVLGRWELRSDPGLHRQWTGTA